MFNLLKERRFAPFFYTQFLGAFNDNLFKNALVIAITFKLSQETAPMMVNLAAGLFILPFFIFSAVAGLYTDKVEKSALIRKIKLLEIGIMFLAAVGFYFNNLEFLIFVLFLMGTQSAFFGPVKYSILPQHLKKEELVGGNALVEMGTFLAILLGTILGGVLIAMGNQGGPIVGIVTVLVAVMGWVSSRNIPKAVAGDVDLQVKFNPFSETWKLMKFVQENRTIYLSILGISWFWFYGFFFLSQFPAYAKDYILGSEEIVTLLLTMFSIGIGLGSYLCERMSGKQVELGLVPIGSFGLTVFALDLFFASLSLSGVPVESVGQFISSWVNIRILFDLIMIGLFGGIYIVPLYALIQDRSDPKQCARVIAGNNVFNALFMVGAAVMAVLLLKLGMSVPQFFLLIAIFNVFISVYIFTLIPEFMMRFVVWMIVRIFYSIEKENLESIPKEGAAVLVCNHVSFVDALIITSICRRPIRFVMDHNIFKIPLLNFVFRGSKTIPIAPKREDELMYERSFELIEEALTEGELVCIFPEGKITFDGNMNKFRPGIMRIIEKTPVPVIPCALQGLWGSYFSRKGGAAFQGLPKVFYKKIGVIASKPILPKEVTLQSLGEQIAKLRGDWQ